VGHEEADEAIQNPCASRSQGNEEERAGEEGEKKKAPYVVQIIFDGIVRCGPEPTRVEDAIRLAVKDAHKAPEEGKEETGKEKYAHSNPRGAILPFDSRLQPVQAETRGDGEEKDEEGDEFHGIADG